MITDMTVMFYVNNVEKSANFWKMLGFEEAFRQDLGSGHETVLLKYADTGAALQLYDIDFIRKNQPELVNRKPVLLFSTEYIDEIYKKAQMTQLNVSEIVSYGDQQAFTFTDPDNNLFTVIGEQVEVPATEKDLTEFDENIKNLIPLSFEAIELLKVPAYIFFGRKTCPWTRRVAKEFSDLTMPVYWVDTEGTDSTHFIRQKYNVETVPTLIKRASSGGYVKFDKKKQTVIQFLGK